MCVLFVITSLFVNSANRERHILKKTDVIFGKPSSNVFST